MKIQKYLFPIAIAGLLYSCSGNSSSETAAKTETSKEKIESAKASVAKTFNLNEAAEAGGIVHTLTFLEKLDAIPASYTIEKFKNIAKDKPAADGFIWYHIKGTTTNKSGKSASVKSISLKLKDAAGNEYKMDTKVSTYVDRDKMPTAIDVQPTQTVEWEAYYMLPKNASGVQLMASDLKYVPDSWVAFNL